jgi:hypothetical protein
LLNAQDAFPEKESFQWISFQQGQLQYALYREIQLHVCIHETGDQQISFQYGIIVLTTPL